jgi:lipoate-protein ligase A
MDSLRLIESGFCDAATNMAVDEALFLSYRNHLSVPTLRLYGWEPAAFSIGYSQDPFQLLNLDALKEKKIDLVRRPTGGGILFHDNELTYSIVGVSGDFSHSKSVKESFEKITGFLIEAYRMLGAQAKFSKAKTVSPHAVADFCFARKEEYDIVIQGKKIGGNAQKRRHDIILQHGSIPLAFDKNRIKNFFKKPEVFDALEIATIAEISLTGISFHQLAELLAKAFALYFHSRAIRSPLTPQEQMLAEELKRTKYQDRDWNYHRKTPSETLLGQT